MRFLGQPLALDMLAVAATVYKVKIVVHFGPTNPMTFIDSRSVNSIIHLRCLGGVHFNLLQSDLQPDEVQLVAVAKYQTPAMNEAPPASIPEVDDTTPCEKLESSCDHDQRTQCSLTAFCYDVPLCGLLDTGAAVGMISADCRRLQDRLLSSHDPAIVIQKVNIPITGLCGPTRCERLIHAQISVSFHHPPVTTVLLVDENDSFGHCLLLGVDFIRTVGICLDFARLQIRLGEEAVSMFADPSAVRLRAA